MSLLRRHITGGFKKPLFTFSTNRTGTFAPIATTSGGSGYWVIDGVTYLTDTPSVELIGSVIEVSYYNKASNLIYLSIPGLYLYSDFDLSLCTSLESITFGGMSYQTERTIKIPPSLLKLDIATSAYIGNIIGLEFCLSLRELIIPATTGLPVITLPPGGTLLTFNAYGNGLLSLPSFANQTNITSFSIFGSTKLTTVDISLLNKLGGYTRLNGLTNVTAIIFPSGSINIMHLLIHANPKVTSYDLSTTLISTLFAYNCPLLNSITFKTNHSFPIFRIENNPNLSYLNLVNFNTIEVTQDFRISGVNFSGAIIAFGTKIKPLNNIEMIECSMSIPDLYNNMKNIYDTKGTGWNNGLNKILNMAHAVIVNKTALAPTGFSLGVNDGSIIIPVNDAEREQALREMKYVLELQEISTIDPTKKYWWTITL